jgi:hypothetical protein
MAMLSNEDLHAIGAIVDEKIKANNDVQTEKILDTVLSVVKEGFDGVDEKFAAIDRKFEAVDGQFAKMKHELMDHTDRVVQKAVGDLRAELREANVLAS